MNNKKWMIKRKKEIKNIKISLKKKKLNYKFKKLMVAKNKNKLKKWRHNKHNDVTITIMTTQRQKTSNIKKNRIKN